MKVLTFTSLFPSRVEPEHGVFIYQRMAHFAKRSGNVVQVIAPVPYFPPWFPWSRRHVYSRVSQREWIGNLEASHPRYPLIPTVSMVLHGLLMFLGSVGTARRLHRQHHFDCIDAHYVFPDGFAAVLLGKVLNLPVVVSARGTDMNLFPSFRSIKPLIQWTLRHVAGGVGVCTPLLQAMVENGLPANRGRVIGNGVDIGRFYPMAQRQCRQELGMSETQKVLVAVGALIPRKGFHFLIPALAKIARDHPNAVLYIVGKGPQRDELEQLARKLGIAESVVLAGPCANDQLLRYYNAADVSCLTSSREGWPNVLLESMACGTPVVATGVWGVPEVVVSPELGVIVEQAVDSIASGLDVALRKQWDRQRIAQFARGRTWDVVAAEVQEHLSFAIGTVTRPSGS